MHFSHVDPSKSSGSSAPSGDFDLQERPLIPFKPSLEESSVDSLKASIINIEENSLEDLADKEAEPGINDIRTSVLTWKDRGNFHLKRQELDLAIESYTKYLQKAEEGDNIEDVGNALKYLATAFMEKEQWAFAARIFNCGLAIYEKHSLGDRKGKKSILSLLGELESRFLNKECGIKLAFIDPNIVIERRQRLASLREAIREKMIQNYSTHKILKEFSKDISSFLESLINHGRHFFGEPPCQFSMIGLGSLARNEMSPYSDLEFALLITNNNPENLNYFKKLVQWLEIQIINLGETELKILDGGYLSPVPRGFSFDDGGNTPLGKQNYVLLIQPPESLALLQSEKYYEEDLILSNTLKDAGFLIGDEALFQNYVDSMQMILESPCKHNNLSVGQDRAVNIINGHLIEFEPQINEEKEKIPVFNIKTELYRLPTFLIGALSDYYGIKEQNFSDKLNALVEKKILSEEGANHLRSAFNSILTLRTRSHLFYGRECDEIYHPMFKQSNMNTTNSKQLLFLSEEDTHQIVEIYQVILPLHKAFKNAFKGKKIADLSQQTFFDATLQTQGKAFEKLFDYQQAKNCYGAALALNPDDEEIHLRLAKTLYTTADYLNALASLKKCETLATSKENEEVLAVALNLQGLVIQAQGNINEAVELYRKSLAINIKKKNINLLADLINLGVAWKALGNEKNALECYEDALSYYEKLSFNESPIIATILSNMGEIYRSSGNSKRAIECHSRALDLDKKFYGNEHPALAIKLNNLGLDFKASGDFKKAIFYYEEALRIDEKIYGKVHPMVSIRLNNLALAWQGLKKPKKALEYLERALFIDEKVYGNEHPDVALRLSNIGMVWLDLGDANQAAQYVERALEIDQKKYGNFHPDVATDFMNLGKIAEISGEIYKALGLYREAIIINFKVFDDPGDLRIASSLMHFHVIWEKLSKAEQLVHRDKYLLVEHILNLCMISSMKKDKANAPDEILDEHTLLVVVDHPRESNSGTSQTCCCVLS